MKQEHSDIWVLVWVWIEATFTPGFIITLIVIIGGGAALIYIYQKINLPLKMQREQQEHEKEMERLRGNGDQPPSSSETPPSDAPPQQSEWEEAVSLMRELITALEVHHLNKSQMALGEVNRALEVLVRFTRKPLTFLSAAEINQIKPFTTTLGEWYAHSRSRKTEQSRVEGYQKMIGDIEAFIKQLETVIAIQRESKELAEALEVLSEALGNPNDGLVGASFTAAQETHRNARNIPQDRRDEIAKILVRTKQHLRRPKNENTMSRIIETGWRQDEINNAIQGLTQTQKKN